MAAVVAQVPAGGKSVKRLISNLLSKCKLTFMKSLICSLINKKVMSANLLFWLDYKEFIWKSMKSLVEGKTSDQTEIAMM